jgi:hypothetical protein
LDAGVFVLVRKNTANGFANMPELRIMVEKEYVKNLQ